MTRLRAVWVTQAAVGWAVAPPEVGVHYPRSTGEFLAWFGSDVDCLDHLQWLRWPKGFVCPRCWGAGG
jgi:hypothetical protein